MKKTYNDCIAYLESFIDYEKASCSAYASSFKLGRVRRLLKVIEINPGLLKTVHIAGTKGKGSTATMLASILSSCGLKAGLYTSPHLTDFRERIKIFRVSSASPVAPKVIPKQALIDLVYRFRLGLEACRHSKAYGTLSFFEVYTALAFAYFIDQGVDIAILEAGMGGRLDATNVVKPLVSVITRISYDHTQYLGRTIRKISLEKAGIIKRRTPVVTCRQTPASRDALIARAKELKAKIYRAREHFSFKNLQYNSRYTQFDFMSFMGRYPGVRIPLLGAHQAENASLALFAALLLQKKFNIKEACIRKGLQSVSLEARFQVIRMRERTFVFDIAHNPLSIKILNKTLRTYFPDQKILLVFGCSQDKDVKNMLKNILFDKIILTQAHHPRAGSPFDIKRVAGLRNGVVIEDSFSALRKACKCASGHDIIVVTGSLFLVAELKPKLKSIP